MITTEQQRKAESFVRDLEEEQRMQRIFADHRQKYGSDPWYTLNFDINKRIVAGAFAEIGVTMDDELYLRWVHSPVEGIDE